ncbi:hypothetical protein A6768_11645 [Sphingobium yanoikuyae]|uniref:Uncharacterized protein n=2 Tax=Sphingobium yanoikuyae TaxID=13690 RepID=A0A291MZZ3_SPHYA|nr:hypothetical protein A6768_11645 [Sphingobium yanoikuyae]
MRNGNSISGDGPQYDLATISAIASCSAAIARLDARISVSLVAPAWALRAAWSGYARALQLQGAEIDEIDVFSWGCGLKIPGRSPRATHIDQFELFEDWREGLGRGDHPTVCYGPASGHAIALTGPDHPPLVRAIDLVRQHARRDASPAPWLMLPFWLKDLRLSAQAHPCLVGGTKALRMKARLSEPDWLAPCRALEASAVDGLARLDQLERLYRDTQRAIMGAHRAGALPALAALTFHRPLLSPRSVSELLGMSVAGASKLLERAVEAGLVVEIGTRRTWRLFVTRDLAIDLGFAPPSRGRPRHEPPLPPAGRDLSQAVAAFDAQMEAMDKLLNRTGAGGSV